MILLIYINVKLTNFMNIIWRSVFVFFGNNLYYFLNGKSNNQCSLTKS